MSALTIAFDNLITEAKFAFHAGDMDKASALLQKAQALTEKPRLETGAELNRHQEAIHA